MSVVSFCMYEDYTMSGVLHVQTAAGEAATGDGASRQPAAGGGLHGQCLACRHGAPCARQPLQDGLLHAPCNGAFPHPPGHQPHGSHGHPPSTVSSVTFLNPLNAYMYNVTITYLLCSSFYSPKLRQLKKLVSLLKDINKIYQYDCF